MLALAVAYFVAAKLALLLAIPPSLAAPVWPAAGVALAAILMGGNRYLPGVLLGAFAANLLVTVSAGGTIDTARPLLSALLIAVGATAQAGVASALVKYVVRFPNTLTQRQDVFNLLFFGGAVGSLVNAIWGPLVLLFSGIISWQAYWSAAFAWWAGDAIGVVIMTPLLLLCLAHDESIFRKIFVGIPMVLVTALSIFIFIGVQASDRKDIQDGFDRAAESLAVELEKDIQTYLNILTANERLINASDHVSLEEFTIFIDEFLKKNPSILSLSWNPKVNDADRAAHEQDIRAQGFPDYVIKDRIGLGEIEAAQKRDHYFPVGYVVPYAGNSAAHGFDTYGPDEVTDNIRQRVLDQARDEGRAIATGRISVVQAEDQYGLLIYNPVYNNDMKGATLEERRRHLIGYTAGVFVMPALLGPVTDLAKASGMDLVLKAIPGSTSQLLYDSRTVDFQEPTVPFALSENTMRSSIKLNVIGQAWELTALENENYRNGAQTLNYWYLLLAGLLISAGFGMFLLVISAGAQNIRRELAHEHESLQASPIWMSTVAAAASILLTYGAWQGFKSQEERLVDSVLVEEVQQLEQGLKRTFDQQLGAIQRMAGRWNVNGRPSKALWQQDAAAYLRDFDGLTSLKWVDNKFFVRWAEPLSGNEVALGKDLFLEETRRESLIQIRDNRQMVVTGPDGLIENKGVFAYFPVYMDGDFDGYILSEFDFEKLFDSAFPEQFSNDYSVKISTNGSAIFFSEGFEDLSVEKQKVTHNVEIRGTVWEFDVRPKSDFIKRNETFLTEIVFLGGLLFSVILSIAIYAGSMSNQRNKLLQVQTAILREQDVERERLIGRLTVSNEELERFAFVCSHDLQEPLRMIRSFSEKLQMHISDDLKGDAKGQKYFHFIIDGAERAQTLIADILTYSSINSDTRRFERFDCQDVVRVVIDNMSENLRVNKGRITHDPLPHLTGNKTQIMQIFQNLINNGLKYQYPRVIPHVHIGVEDQVSHWRFSIKDNGIGIEERYLNKIFDVFQRLNRKNIYAGTGVGLSICKKVVERHGGTIWAESTKDIGSTFYFTLAKGGD